MRGQYTMKWGNPPADDILKEFAFKVQHYAQEDRVTLDSLDIYLDSIAHELVSRIRWSFYEAARQETVTYRHCANDWQRFRRWMVYDQLSPTFCRHVWNIAKWLVDEQLSAPLARFVARRFRPIEYVTFSKTVKARALFRDCPSRVHGTEMRFRVYEDDMPMRPQGDEMEERQRLEIMDRIHRYIPREEVCSSR